MATEPDLETAGYMAWQNLQPFWITGTLKAKLTAFASSLYDVFPEQAPNNHPVTNWLVQISALAATMNGNASADTGALRDSVQFVYRLCFMTAQLQIQTLITAPQADAVLDAYNANF